MFKIFFSLVSLVSFIFCSQNKNCKPPAGASFTDTLEYPEEHHFKNLGSLLLEAIMPKRILALMENILFFSAQIQKMELSATRYGWEKFLKKRRSLLHQN